MSICCRCWSKRVTTAPGGWSAGTGNCRRWPETEMAWTPMMRGRRVALRFLEWAVISSDFPFKGHWWEYSILYLLKQTDKSLNFPACVCCNRLYNQPAPYHHKPLIKWQFYSLASRINQISHMFFWDHHYFQLWNDNLKKTFSCLRLKSLLDFAFPSSDNTRTSWRTWRRTRHWGRTLTSTEVSSWALQTWHLKTLSTHRDSHPLQEFFESIDFWISLYIFFGKWICNYNCSHRFIISDILDDN